MSKRKAQHLTYWSLRGIYYNMFYYSGSLNKAVKILASARMFCIVLVLLVPILVGCTQTGYSIAPQGQLKLIGAINTIRVKAGLAEVRPCRALTTIAERQAVRLADQGFVAHNTNQIKSLEDRLRVGGYKNWSSAGENLGQGYKSVKTLVYAWMASSEHRLVLQNGSYLDIGVGRVNGNKTEGFPFWVAVFGREGTC